MFFKTNAMEKIREHIQDNLTTAEHAYDDAFNRHYEANEKLKLLQQDVSRFQFDMERAEKDMIYYQELLNELNENKK